MKNKADDMKNNITGYPGEYKPPPFNLDDVMMELKTEREGNVKPLTNISECDDYVKIEVTAPGHRREDFIVSIRDNKLLILALSKEPKGNTNEYRKHEFNYNCFSHLLDLPENIDSDFVKATYKSGILIFYFPKEKTTSNHTVSKVVIY